MTTTTSPTTRSTPPSARTWTPRLRRWTPAAVLARVESRSRPPSPPRFAAAGWLDVGVLGAAGLAACLLVGLFLTGARPGSRHRRRLASAAEIIEEAKAAHEAPGVDRCYQVVADWDIEPLHAAARLRPASARPSGPAGTSSCAVDVDDGPEWAWGQDAAGGCGWRPTGKHAIVFNRDELNDPLARSLRADEPAAGQHARRGAGGLRALPQGRRTAGRADPHRGGSAAGGDPRARFRKLELELDPGTKMVRRAVFHRYLNGDVRGDDHVHPGRDGHPTRRLLRAQGHIDPRRSSTTAARCQPAAAPEPAGQVRRRTDEAVGEPRPVTPDPCSPGPPAGHFTAMPPTMIAGCSPRSPAGISPRSPPWWTATARWCGVCRRHPERAAGRGRIPGGVRAAGAEGEGAAPPHVAGELAVRRGVPGGEPGGRPWSTRRKLREQRPPGAGRRHRPGE